MRLFAVLLFAVAMMPLGSVKAQNTAALNPDSIYNLHTVLLDTEGQERPIEELQGHPVVISMAYTSCAYACPLIISQMQQLEKALDKKKDKATQFVLVSFDPKNDTPEVLKEYAKKRQLSSRWKLFTTKSDGDAREVANLLGIKFKRTTGKDYDHSFIITVLDREGVIQGQQTGANADVKDLMKYLP